MFKRLRELNISLASKCQMLFGAAVALIIAAALFVPWQRIEQLTEQMNERTAKALTEWAEADHVARQRAAAGAATRPATTRPAATQPSTRPADEPGQVVRLILAGRQDNLSRFESRAMKRFLERAESDAYIKTYDPSDGPPIYQYARPLYATPACVQCHLQDVPATRPSADHPALLGMASVEIPHQVEANQIFLNRFFIFLAGVLAGVLAIIVFYAITTRLILGPVRVLQETAEKVSKGDLNIRSDISTGDEFQQLSETFNRMLGNLKQGEDQLRAINKALDAKLSEMAQSNLALYESNRLKSEFLANVSHELRTPLNSILGFAELLRDAGASADPKAARYLQNIVNSGRHLLGLITELLDLAKIEAGRMEVRSEPLSLGDLFEGLCNIIKPLSEKKQLAIVPAVARDVPILHTDPGKLQQVLYNFLSNAIKFSPVGGKIDLVAERAGEECVRIAVSDQGPGIAAEKQSMIFEKFRQLDGSVTREHEGAGLGLAISKELTRLMGGTIAVQSRPGEGATFSITIPLKIEAGPQAVMATLANA